MRTFRENFNQDDAGGEASDVCPEGDATLLCGFGNDGDGSAEELIKEPIAEHEPGGHMEEEDGREPDQHAGARIENEVGSENAGDGSAGSNRGKARAGINEDLREGRGDSAGEIEDKIFEVAEEVFDVVAEDPKKKHVPGDVHKRSVQKHGSEDRHDCSGRINVRVTREQGNGMAGDESELHDERVQSTGALHLNRDFPEIDQRVQDNQEIIDERRREGRLVVTKGNHSRLSNLVICN